MARGEFVVGDVIKAPAVVVGYGPEPWRPSVSVRVAEITRRGELRVMLDQGHGDRPLFRMSVAEGISANGVG
jgi:hypothetical protein